jgi:hypothetical protein
MSPDMNHIEHAWELIGRKINQRNPKCKNIDELRTAILQKWQQFPQEWLRRLVRSMSHGIFGLESTSPTYSQRKNNPYIYTPTPNSSCAQNVVVLNEVFRWRQTLARPSVGRNKKRLSSDQWTRNCTTFFTARGCSDNSMACDVARHEPYRACMGIDWPKN